MPHRNSRIVLRLGLPGDYRLFFLGEGAGGGALAMNVLLMQQWGTLASNPRELKSSRRTLCSACKDFFIPFTHARVVPVGFPPQL